MLILLCVCVLECVCVYSCTSHSLQTAFVCGTMQQFKRKILLCCLIYVIIYDFRDSKIFNGVVPYLTFYIMYHQWFLTRDPWPLRRSTEKFVGVLWPVNELGWFLKMVVILVIFNAFFNQGSTAAIRPKSQVHSQKQIKNHCYKQYRQEQMKMCKKFRKISSTQWRQEY